MNDQDIIDAEHEHSGTWSLTYSICKANATAQCFVTKKLPRPSWIVLATSSNYAKACAARDAINAR